MSKSINKKRLQKKHDHESGFFEDRDYCLHDTHKNNMTCSRQQSKKNLVNDICNKKLKRSSRTSSSTSDYVPVKMRKTTGFVNSLQSKRLLQTKEELINGSNEMGNDILNGRKRKQVNEKFENSKKQHGRNFKKNQIDDDQTSMIRDKNNYRDMRDTHSISSDSQTKKDSIHFNKSDDNCSEKSNETITFVHESISAYTGGNNNDQNHCELNNHHNNDHDADDDSSDIESKTIFKNLHKNDKRQNLSDNKIKHSVGERNESKDSNGDVINPKKKIEKSDSVIIVSSSNHEKELEEISRINTKGMFKFIHFLYYTPIQ